MSNPNYTKVDNTVLNNSAFRDAELSSRIGRFMTHAAAGVLTQAEIDCAINGCLIVDVSAANNLQVGADTAANALALQNAFHIPNLNDSVILNIYPNSNTVGLSDIALANTSVTHVQVDISLAGTDSNTQQLFDTDPAAGVGVGASAIVLVTNTGSTAGASMIRFTILQQGGFNA